MPEIFRITKPEEFDLPSLGNFIRHAISTNKLVTDVDKAVEETKRSIGSPMLGLFVTNHDNKWTGLAITQLNPSAFNNALVVIHFFSTNEPGSRNLLLNTMTEFAVANGFGRIIGVDTNDKSKAFQRLFKQIGTPVSTGQLVVFDIAEGLI